MSWGDEVNQPAPSVSSAAGYVLCCVLAVFRCDWDLARWAAREAAMARAREAWEL
ncbi:MAG TPA: hypothetical protein VHC69_31640 [Polyangiaceae bacterium]|nr:hypothetical protein [Polyangiaceae bacterium]